MSSVHRRPRAIAAADPETLVVGLVARGRCHVTQENRTSVIKRSDKLFEARGVIVGEWIRDKRLDRCRRDLGDRSLPGETIPAIASRWELTNAAHFSRLFRDAHDCSPREFRKRAGAPPGGPVGVSGVSRSVGPSDSDAET